MWRGISLIRCCHQTLFPRISQTSSKELLKHSWTNTNFTLYYLNSTLKHCSLLFSTFFYKFEHLQIFNERGMFVKRIGINFVDIVAGMTTTPDGMVVVIDSVRPTIFIIDPETGKPLRFMECAGLNFTFLGFCFFTFIVSFAENGIFDCLRVYYKQ